MSRGRLDEARHFVACSSTPRRTATRTSSRRPKSSASIAIPIGLWASASGLRPLGFGIGEHFCIGANLARKTSGSLFRELTSRIEEVELVGEPERLASNLVPGFKHMPIQYRIRPAADA